MENLLPSIIPFGTSTSIRRVSSSWRDQVDRNNEQIIQSLRRKYPESDTISDILRQAIRNKDITTFKKIVDEYKGFLPVVWEQFFGEKWLQKTIKSKMRRSRYMAYTVYGDTIENTNKATRRFLKRPTLNEFIHFTNIFDTLFLEGLYATPEGKQILQQMLSKTDVAEKFGMRIILWLYNHGLYTDVPNMSNTINTDAVKAYIIAKDDVALLKEREQQIRRNSLYITAASHGSPGTIWKYLASDNRIVDHIIRDGRYRVIPFLLYAVQNGTNEVKRTILKSSMENRTWDVLDKYINKDNILEYIQYGLANPEDYEDWYPKLYAFLAYKGLHPEWFFYYYDNGIQPPESFWTKLLANAIVYGNEDLVTRIIRKHKGSITPVRKERILALTNNNSMRQLINQLL